VGTLRVAVLEGRGVCVGTLRVAVPVIVGCSAVGGRLVRVGSRGVHVSVTVGVPGVADNAGVRVTVGDSVSVGVGLDAAVGVLMGDAVAVKKRIAKASRVSIFSTLKVGVAESTTEGKSLGCVSRISPPETRIGIPTLIAVIATIATNSRLLFVFIPENFP
jgi:hypothetical protein